MPSRVDDYYAFFTTAVARGLGVPVVQVCDGMGQGRVLGADAAQAAWRPSTRSSGRCAVMPRPAPGRRQIVPPTCNGQLKFCEDGSDDKKTGIQPMGSVALAIAFLSLARRTMSSTLVWDAIVAASSVVLLATWAIVFFPVLRVAVFVTIPVIATIVAGAEGYGNAWCLDAHVAEIDVNIDSIGKTWRGCNHST